MLLGGRDGGTYGHAAQTGVDAERAHVLVKRAVEALNADCGDDRRRDAGVADGHGNVVAGAQTHEVVDEVIVGELERFLGLGVSGGRDDLVREELG